MSTSSRQRGFIIAAIVAIGLLVLDRILFTPLVNHWTHRSNEIANLSKSIATGNSAIERADRTTALWKEIETGALPRDPAVAEQTVVSAFDQWGRAHRVEMASIKPQWKRGANARYSLLECRVDATGSLSALSRLLYEVEKSPLALRVESVEFTSRDEGGQTLALGLIVTGLRLAPLEPKS